MTLKSSFKLALNKIHVNPDSGNSPTSYNCLGGLLFRLVVQEETKYINFVLAGEEPNPLLFEPVKDFVRLITRAEFVSLTFNTLYIDSTNRKIVFRPSMLPCYSYEFDFLEGSLFHFKRELADTCLSLGFLTLKKLQLDAIDYMLDNDNYHSALDKDETDHIDKKEKPLSTGGL